MTEGLPDPKKAVGGCLGGCAGLVALVVTGLGTVVFTARDVISTYFPMQARALGLGWFAEQPRAPAVHHDGPAVSCTFDWRQSGLSSARYDLSCRAAEDVELSGFQVVAMPALGGDRYERYHEDQRFLAGSTVPVDGGRTWTYTGTISLDPPWADGRDRLLFAMDVAWEGGEEHVELVSEEPLRP